MIHSLLRKSKHCYCGKALAEHGLTEDVLRKAKRYSFTDSVIARYANTTVEDVRTKRKEWNILPTYKYV